MRHEGRWPERALAAVVFAAALCAAIPTASALPDTGGGNAMPQIKTHAPIGFRLYRPGYRPAGKGVSVSVQLCRLPFWAGASPQHLRVERMSRDGQLSESHDQSLGRLGWRLGNNCTSGAVRLDTPPGYGETIKICALWGGGNCP